MATYLLSAAEVECSGSTNRRGNYSASTDTLGSFVRGANILQSTARQSNTERVIFAFASASLLATIYTVLQLF